MVFKILCMRQLYNKMVAKRRSKKSPRRKSTRKSTRRKSTRKSTRRKSTRKSTRRKSTRKSTRRDCGWPAYLAPGISRNKSCSLNYVIEELEKLDGYTWEKTRSAERNNTIPSYVKPYLYSKPKPFRR